MAHGAGAGMTHPFMIAVADGLEQRRVATLRYQFPSVEAGSKRPDRPALAQTTVRAAVAIALKEAPELPLFAGGKSFGGRMTSQTQAASPMPQLRGLVFFGFPLHSPGKPSIEHAEHLGRVIIPMLFIQGTRDALAEAPKLTATMKQLASHATLLSVDQADHSFHVPVRSGRTDSEVLDEMLDSMVRLDDGSLKIATFNINSVNKRLPNLLAWLNDTAPDVVCLQELKAEQKAFPERALLDAGYFAVWQGQKSWNGVAILSKQRPPIAIRTELPGDPDDKQSRYIEAAVGGILIASIYLPNGNPQPGAKFDYKLAWFERPHRSRLHSDGGRRARHSRRRLQRRPDRCRHLSDVFVPRQCPAATRQSHGLQPVAVARMVRCDPHPTSGRTDLHLLGLQTGAMDAGRGPQTRPPPAQSIRGRTAFCR